MQNHSNSGMLDRVRLFFSLFSAFSLIMHSFPAYIQENHIVFKICFLMCKNNMLSSEISNFSMTREECSGVLLRYLVYTYYRSTCICFQARLSTLPAHSISSPMPYPQPPFIRSPRKTLLGNKPGDKPLGPPPKLLEMDLAPPRNLKVDMFCNI